MNAPAGADGASAFLAAFGVEPQFRIDVPGRVVLVGDHIDYADLSVLPMAIDRHITLHVAARRDAQIRLACTDARFGPRAFPVHEAVHPFPQGDWGNYVKAAVGDLADGVDAPAGFDAIIESRLPVAAGLSSSSAMLIGAGLAFLRANDLAVEPIELARRLAAAERFVGTQGGGMDQAVCLAGRDGHAVRLDFRPLRATVIPMPPSWRFVVASSLERAEKSGAAKDAYNLRVTQSREAFAAVGAGLGHTGRSIRWLIETEGADRLLDAAAGLRPELGRRLRHVATEAARVRSAEAAMRAGDAARFGSIMCESHASLRDDYDVSTHSLDTLVEIATRAGAHGARLSGAGFGGCIVALAAERKVEAVTGALRNDFYAARSVDPDGVLFEVCASAGARVVELA